MNLTRVHHLILLISIILLISGLTLNQGCQKQEGPGGTGSISGRITEKFYNDDYSMLIRQGPAVDEEVFIVYGDEGILGDRIFTSHTGQFRFEFLYPGEYLVYFFSKDSSSVLDETGQKVFQVELGRGEDLDLGELVKLSLLDYDDGAAVIRGKVRLIQYADGSQYPNLVIEYIDNAHEQEVYLTYGNHTFYDERTRTQHDGTFEFRNLIPGEYLVVLYSDDVTGYTEHEVITLRTTITGTDQVADLGEITIKKL